MRYNFIHAEKTLYPIHLLCKAFAVSSSGYYAWRRHVKACYDTIRSFLYGGTDLRVIWGEDEHKKPSFDECVDAAMALSDESSPDEINKALALAVKAKPNPIEKRQILTKIKDATRMPIGDLRKGFDLIRKEKSGPSEDLAHVVAQNTLKKCYASGAYLVRAQDRNFWRYNGKHWERHTDEQVQHNIMSIVKDTVDPESAKACF